MKNNQETYQDLENYGDLFRKPFESTAPWIDPNKFLKLIPNPLKTPIPDAEAIRKRQEALTAFGLGMAKTLETYREEKYFTPDIEDIRVGYELEELFKDGWKAYKVSEGDMETDILTSQRREKLRVPYLTKEQIEAEDWEQRGGPEYFYKPDYKVVYYGIKMLILHKDRTLFEGECKDINTFRYICKLLNIK